MNRIILNGVIASLLLIKPALASYVPSFSLEMEGNANNTDNGLAAISTGVVIPFLEKKGGILFGDMRLSRSSHNMGGIHLGLGIRKKVSDFTIGINSFYDRYIAEQEYSQYVGGVEAVYDIFKVRGTFYYPTSNAFKGFEVEGGINLGSMFLSAKPYYFFHQESDSMQGIGFYAKYERQFRFFHVYAKAGYQFDSYLSHQATVQFGLKVALTRNSRTEDQLIEPIARSMLIYNKNEREMRALTAMLDEEISKLDGDFMAEIQRAKVQQGLGWRTHINGLKNMRSMAGMILKGGLLEIKKSDSKVDLEDIMGLKQKIEAVSEAVTSSSEV